MISKLCQKMPPASVCYSYADEDEELCQELDKHLKNMQRQGIITSWHSRQITAGTNWIEEIQAHIDAAFVILLLVSPDFLSSDHCYDIEMQRALQRYDTQKIHVIPILLRPVDWEGAPFAHLPYLPRNSVPVTSWSNRDEAFLDITKGIRDVLYGQLLPADTNHLAILESHNASISITKRTEVGFSTSLSNMTNIHSRTERIHTFSAKELRFRAEILEHIQDTWIRGYLQKELAHGTFLTPQLQYAFEAVPHERTKIVQELHSAHETLAIGTRLSQVYERTNGSLLLLGEPGAGKTILLLDLVYNLLMKAEQDATRPIPIIIPLAAWITYQQFLIPTPWGKKHFLRKWAMEVLHQWYGLPRHLSKRWINEGHILLLLDGLDEVPEQERATCVKAINNHWQMHGLESPLVVSCRTDEYDILLLQSHQLQLHEAIQIQPLIEEQIHTYLFSEPELKSMYVHLKEDESLHELISRPLMLSILTQTYRGLPPAQVTELLETTSEKELSYLLFRGYTERMLHHRSTHPNYNAEMTLNKLAWLAQQMQKYEQTEFNTGNIKASWLPKGSPRTIYYSTLTILALIVIIPIVVLFWNIIGSISHSFLVFSKPPDESQLIETSSHLVMIGGKWIAQGGIYICGGILLLTFLIRISYIISSNGTIISASKEEYNPKNHSEEQKQQEVIKPISQTPDSDIWPPSCIIVIFFGLLILFFTTFGALINQQSASDADFQEQCTHLGGIIDAQIIGNGSGSSNVDYFCNIPPHVNITSTQAEKIQSLTHNFNSSAFIDGAITGGEIGLLLIIFVLMIMLLLAAPITFYNTTRKWKNNKSDHLKTWKKLTIIICGVGGLLLICYASVLGQAIAQVIVILLSGVTAWNGFLLLACAWIGIVLLGIILIISLLAFLLGTLSFIFAFPAWMLNRAYVYLLLRKFALLPQRDFFTYATSLLFLRQIGEKRTYMFIHPLLRDYFAGLAQPEENKETP